MSNSTAYDAIIVGSGPNGLSAAIRLAQCGLAVLVMEGESTIGGGTRTEELTLPGYLHDVCSAIHPLALASPFLSRLPLGNHGLEWVHPRFPLAHPLGDGRTVIVERSLEQTAVRLGHDGRSYSRLIGPFVRSWKGLVLDLLGPFPFPPTHPLLLARFGLQAIRPAARLAQSSFESQRARALFSGLAAHSILPLNRRPSAGFGLVLGVLAHAVPWPMARSGSRAITDAMASYLETLGGEIITGHRVTSLNEMPKSGCILFDTSPAQVLQIVGDVLEPDYRRRLQRYRYGPGVCKVDWALSEPIPWRDAEVGGAGAVHVGGSMEAIVRSEREVWSGGYPERPFVIVVQQSQFDLTRAPADRHTAWAYCHVPNGSERDVSETIEGQIERYAPGFQDCILDRSVLSARQLQSHNPNYVGGDINVGVQDLRQLFARPTFYRDPYRVPSSDDRFRNRLFLCSSATPPGGGVHGMCGFHAAGSAMRALGFPPGRPGVSSG